MIIAGAGLLLLVILLAIGLPIAFALGISGGVGLYLIGGMTFFSGLLQSTPMSSVAQFELLTIPMFILMAEFLVISGIASQLFVAVNAWVSRAPAGLAVATTVTGALFAAISGSSTASAATLSSTSIPAMTKQGYDPELAAGVVAISGTLAMMIPPSIALVLYGILADKSIAQLLIAGIIPGILVALTIILTVYVLIWRDPSAAPRGRKSTMAEKLTALRVAGPFLFLFGIVTGLIYTGVATPTEAAGLGAFGAFLLALLSGRLTFRQAARALTGAARTSAMIMLVILCAHVFSYFLTLTQVTQYVIGLIGDSGLPSLAVIFIILGIYLILGLFMDQIAVLILTVGIMVPVIESIGYDPIWFGVVVVLVAEVGMVTPPVGLNVFIVSKVTGMPAEKVFRGVAPHVLSHILLIVLLVLFPSIILWLPSTMSH
jgi:C4-dicarboxylate transporter, DctM subunit